MAVPKFALIMREAIAAPVATVINCKATGKLA